MHPKERSIMFEILWSSDGAAVPSLGYGAPEATLPAPLRPPDLYV